MIRISVTLFVIGVLCLFLGLNQWAGLSFEQGRFLLFVLTGAASLAFLGALLLPLKIHAARRPRPESG